MDIRKAEQRTEKQSNGQKSNRIGVVQNRTNEIVHGLITGTKKETVKMIPWRLY